MPYDRRVPSGDRGVIELHVAARVLPHERHGRCAERQALDECAALVYLKCECRVRVLGPRERERSRQPRLEVGARTGLVAHGHERLAELVGAAPATHAPEGLTPVVAGDQIPVVRAQQPLVQRAVAPKLVPQQRLHQRPLAALPVDG